MFCQQTSCSGACCLVRVVCCHSLYLLPSLVLLSCVCVCLTYRYRMDYMQFVDYHRSSGADITIGCIAYDESRASDFGLMKVCVCVRERGGWG